MKTITISKSKHQQPKYHIKFQGKHKTSARTKHSSRHNHYFEMQKPTFEKSRILNQILK